MSEERRSEGSGAVVAIVLVLGILLLLGVVVLFGGAFLFVARSGPMPLPPPSVSTTVAPPLHADLSEPGGVDLESPGPQVENLPVENKDTAEAK